MALIIHSRAFKAEVEEGKGEVIKEKQPNLRRGGNRDINLTFLLLPSRWFYTDEWKPLKPLCKLTVVGSDDCDRTSSYEDSAGCDAG